MDQAIEYGEEVLAARRAGVPIVALESTIISHGLPRPRNAEVARELEAIVRAEGACPATIAVLDGVARVGLGAAELERVANESDLHKLGRRELPLAMAAKASGATTVSATATLAQRAGIAVFSTGGLGGVHRGYVESFDESADLLALAETPITVVAAGVKSILDVPATLERLETLCVTVVGYATTTFPGFYLNSSGSPLSWSLDSPEAVAAVMAAREALGLHSALLVANPVPLAEQLDPSLHDEALAEALEGAQRDGVRGQQITPYLLARLVEATGGAALEANLAAVRNNVRLGARIAVAAAR
ncbi:MAG: pseudouridine-5'-phosphate glycosidase [Actinomycetota bacterium]|nr:pseudouridine-5'-phosphate glycosidase [Actinomycetota bacterium]